MRRAHQLRQIFQAVAQGAIHCEQVPAARHGVGAALHQQRQLVLLILCTCTAVEQLLQGGHEVGRAAKRRGQGCGGRERGWRWQQLRPRGATYVRKVVLLHALRACSLLVLLTHVAARIIWCTHEHHSPRHCKNESCFMCSGAFKQNAPSELSCTKQSRPCGDAPGTHAHRLAQPWHSAAPPLSAGGARAADLDAALRKRCAKHRACQLLCCVLCQ